MKAIEIVNGWKGDKIIWMMLFFFILVSIISVYSFVPILVRIEGGTPFKYLFKHIVSIAISIFAMRYVLRFPPIFFKKIASIALYVSIALLVYTFFFGQKVNHAGRWITIPFISLTFQTSDIVKLALILYIAQVLDKKQEVLNSWKEAFVPLVIPIFIVFGFILKDNFSTAILVLLLSIALLYIGNYPIGKILSIFGIIIVMGSMAIVVHKSVPSLNILPRYETWENRIFNRFSEEAKDDPDYIINNAQAKNAELGIYNGGLIGQGLGNGKVKEFVPEAYADFYYASFVEEFGFFGAFFLLFFYFILFLRITRIALHTEKVYEKVIVFGIGIGMMAQALVNMFVCTGILPVTGQNMPLLAMGGSAMITAFVSIGIVQSIADKNSSKVNNSKMETDEN